MKNRRVNLKPGLLAFALAAAFGTSAHAVGAKVTWDDIRNDDKTPGDVLTYGLGLKAQRHSTLKTVNTKNVAGLVPAWSFSFGGEKQRGQESQALVHDGVIYVTASYSRIYAIDARTGKRLWEYEARLPEDIRPCCDVVNRGAAIYGDKIYFGTLDAGIVALNKDTGKVVWKKKWGDHKVGYTMTGAPFVIQDQKSGKVLLVHGSSGDEFGVVGWLFARDPDTGEEVWARPMVEGHMGRLNGKDSTPTGDPAPLWPRTRTARRSRPGATAAAPLADRQLRPEKNMVVIGAGNPAPWNTWKRTKEGDDPRNWDSLFTSGQAYVDASTGELKGFFQHTPNDAWDFSGNNSVVLFEYKDPKTGKLVKASAHADRNGFFFVTDREKLPPAPATPTSPPR
jgi:alcohol dehydrogenase (cytochrome c)